MVGCDASLTSLLMSSQEAAGSGREEEEEERQVMPQRIWILTGGDSSERRESLASGLAAWLRLRTQIEVSQSLAFIFSSHLGSEQMPDHDALRRLI